MRIATWNVERLKHKRELDRMQECCMRARADILVLTETDRGIKPPYPYCFETMPVKPVWPDLYRDTENRVSIYSRYACIREHPTFDRYTALCVELETELGNLIVYGTIMGILGNRDSSYVRDLQKQTGDIRRLSGLGNLCVIGDYNCSFSDNYYFTESGRGALRQCFAENKMTVLTASRPECVDHIAVSDALVSGYRTAVEEWNIDKELSDHKGIVVDIRENSR